MPHLTPLRAFVVTSLLVLAVACGEGYPEGVRLVTATPRVVRAFPTSTPTAADLLGLPGFRVFPKELEYESRRLDTKSVEELWLEYLAGSRLVNDRTAEPRYDLCSDRTGAWLGTDLPEGVTFTWDAVRLGDEVDWNSITVVMKFDNAPGALGNPDVRFHDVHGRKRGEFLGPFGSPADGPGNGPQGQRLFIDSPDCD